MIEACHVHAGSIYAWSNRWCVAWSRRWCWAGLVVGAIYGVDRLRALDSAGASAGAWAGALFACLLLTWGMQGWRTLRRDPVSE